MKTRHYTIPVFIPEAACPNRCVFCNQRNIANVVLAPTIEEVQQKIDNYLTTIPKGNTIEIGFFGGNFTGIPEKEQKAYLQIAQPYLKSNIINGIRISTRPDYITNNNIQFLKSYHVSVIELGTQSLNDEVLTISGRGHTVSQVHEAAELIKSNGLQLGMQMMIGLPADNLEKSIFTAKEIIRLGADNTRIYPTLVIKDTELEQWFNKGIYKPLSLQEAIIQVAAIVPLFINAGVTILRIGLHPSEGLLNHTHLIAGPFHVAFGEMVYSTIWHNKFINNTLLNTKGENLTVSVPKGMINAAIGHQSHNKQYLLQYYKKVKFVEKNELMNFEYYVDIS